MPKSIQQIATERNLSADRVRAVAGAKVDQIAAECRCPIAHVRAQLAAGDLPDNLAASIERFVDEQEMASYRQPIPRAIEAALCLRLGVSESILAQHYHADVLDAAHSRDVRDAATLHGLLHAQAARMSFDKPQRQWDDGTYRWLAAAGGGNGGTGTLNVNGILGNVADKLILDGYGATEATWPTIAARRDAETLRVHNHYRLQPNGRFNQIGGDNSVRVLPFSEDAFTSTMRTTGALLRITRQQAINDDLSAFSARARMFGRLAAIAIEQALYKLLLANTGNFFHSDNGNLLTGGGSALGLTALGAAVSAMRKQTDPTGAPVLARPAILLVGSALESTGRDTLEEWNAGVDPGQRMRLAVSPYLDNTAIRDDAQVAIENQSATLWYVLAEPRQVAALCVSFLNGREAPTISTRQNGAEFLGVEVRAHSDWGVGFEDSNAAVRNDGA